MIDYISLHLNFNYTVPCKPEGPSNVIMVLFGVARAWCWYVTCLVPGARTWSRYHLSSGGRSAVEAE